MREISRPTISAVYLMAPLPDRRSTTVVPEGFTITKCSARWASGSRRPVKGGRGDGPATNSVATLVSSAYDKRAVTAYAATSNINRS